MQGWSLWPRSISCSLMPLSARTFHSHAELRKSSPGKRVQPRGAPIQLGLGLLVDDPEPRGFRQQLAISRQGTVIACAAAQCAPSLTPWSVTGVLRPHRFRSFPVILSMMSASEAVDLVHACRRGCAPEPSVGPGTVEEDAAGHRAIGEGPFDVAGDTACRPGDAVAVGPRVDVGPDLDHVV
jgi:hypothetical protein